ncbi:zinc-binding dehydrogenase [Nocardia sp. CA-107356]|uniref:zinc-binding dehydrogenase n=1 Tax=Nocardia sp. CA-107356 TaxID=3239972 RepID=UPI003D94516E
MPNKRNAHFFNLWAGKRNRARFRAEIAADLTAVFDLAAAGILRALVAARIPLAEAAGAMELAESETETGTVTGKVVLIP